MADRERLLKALHQIETAEATRLEQPEVEQREHWKQWAWAVRTDVHATLRGMRRKELDCGTGMCVAGWGCFLEGDTFIWNLDGGQESELVEVDGRRMSISERARELFDLNQRQAELLFNGANSLEYIREVIARILAEQDG